MRIKEGDEWKGVYGLLQANCDVLWNNKLTSYILGDDE